MTGLDDQIKKNYKQVIEKIEIAAEKCGRNPKNINLVVVTKAQPVEKIRAAIEAGATLLGENYPEETETKIHDLAEYSQIAWHMIGHLQSRKIGIVSSHFNMLHSLDSLELAEKLSKKCTDSSKLLAALIEINISGEESKKGFNGWNEAEWPVLAESICKINSLPGVCVRGLMTMPPFFQEVEKSRPYFRKLKKLSEYLSNIKELSPNMGELSMGTSGDYQVAIEEGATYIRIGQAILGERNYH